LRDLIPEPFKSEMYRAGKSCETLRPALVARLFITGIWFFVSLCCPLSRAHAADPAALAETLFRRGKAAMEAGKYDEGCADLRESIRLDRAGGTQLTLALCYERAGRFATAWLAYLEALSFAQRDGRTDREKIAREQAQKMEGLAARLVVRVPPSVAGFAGLSIAMDGEPLGKSAWDTGIPVDPGKHEIAAAANERRRWTQEVTVTQPGERLEVVVPDLALVEAEPPLSPPAEPSKAAPVVVARAAGRACPQCVKPVPPRSPTRKILAAAAGGTGAALLTVGAVFGISAAVQASEVCDRPTCPTSQQGAYDYYRMSATTANVTIGLGVAFVAVSAVLLLTEGDSGSKERN
jgi:hypothetical protein